MLRNDYPIESVYRNGNKKLFRNRSEIAFATRMVYHRCGDFEIDDDKGILFSYSLEENSKRKIQLHDAIFNGELFDIFYNKVCDLLPIHGKTVLDIGANIGDSSFYFALSRANLVIAIEPFPRNYEMAKKNIAVNGFADKIILRLAGCRPETGEITRSFAQKERTQSAYRV
jgi:hypothetical protein